MTEDGRVAKRGIVVTIRDVPDCSLKAQSAYLGAFVLRSYKPGGLQSGAHVVGQYTLLRSALISIDCFASRVGGATCIVVRSTIEREPSRP
jgi:hypothetical protein